MEDGSARSSNKILFCDTDLIVTQVWSEIYFNECPDWIVKENQSRRYDLFLLMDIDVPWVDDGTREFPHLREKHFGRLKLELEQRELPFKIISGILRKG
jgi:HTH-type transcriptional regulator, transcriptional repressor of NAD biosynthesis genes